MKLPLVFLPLAAFVSADKQELLQKTPPARGSGYCPSPGGLSCPIKAGVHVDTCCSEFPGGQFALTQFWNSDASRGHKGYLGPEKAWTLHGLWPDHCDGSFDSICDRRRVGDCSRGRCNRAYSNIAGVLLHHGQQELLANMTMYWKGINGDESIWGHEWDKHGTCVSTLNPRCYGDEYTETAEVVDYFDRAVQIYHTLPSYEWLANAGIVPSKEKTYALQDIVDALTVPRGVSPILACQGRELREIWYHYYVRGSIRFGDFEPTEPVIPGTHTKGCPRDGILYLPKDVQ